MRPLYEIARDILNDPALKGNARTYSEGYLRGLLEMSTVADDYYMESGGMMVAYALGNLTQYRGENARAYKLELKEHLK